MLKNTFENYGLEQYDGNRLVDQATLVVVEDYCHPIPTPEIGASITESREPADSVFIEGEAPVAAKRHGFPDVGSIESWEESQQYALTALTLGRYAIVRQMIEQLKDTDPDKAARYQAAFSLLNIAFVSVAARPRSEAFIDRIVPVAWLAQRTGSRVYAVIGATHMNDGISDQLASYGIPFAVLRVRDQQAPTAEQIDAYYARFANLDREVYKAQWLGHSVRAQASQT